MGTLPVLSGLVVQISLVSAIFLKAEAHMVRFQ